MKEAEGNEVADVRGGERRGRRGKWRIVLVAALVVAGIAAGVFFFRRQGGVGEQLRAMAGESGEYREEVRGPGWYVRLADRYKLPVLKRAVRFSSRAATDEDMAVVGRANTLRRVGLARSDISDAGMAHLEGLSKLQTLFLDKTKIGDAGVAHLSELAELRTLSLAGTQVSDTGMAHLAELRKMQTL